MSNHVNTSCGGDSALHFKPSKRINKARAGRSSRKASNWNKRNDPARFGTFPVTMHRVRRAATQ